MWRWTRGSTPFICVAIAIGFLGATYSRILVKAELWKALTSFIKCFPTSWLVSRAMQGHCFYPYVALDPRVNPFICVTPKWHPSDTQLTPKWHPIYTQLTPKWDPNETHMTWHCRVTAGQPLLYVSPFTVIKITITTLDPPAIQPLMRRYCIGCDKNRNNNKKQQKD